jgi:hypothetical protein
MKGLRSRRRCEARLLLSRDARLLVAHHAPTLLLLPALSALALAPGCARVHWATDTTDTADPERDAAVLAPDASIALDASLDASLDSLDASLERWTGCGTAAPLWPGPLTCVDTSCSASSTIVDGAHHRNDRPSIAVSSSGAPTILFSTAEGGYTGWLATRVAAEFELTRIAETATGALVIGSEGCGFAFLNDGALGAGLYRVDVDDGALTPVYAGLSRYIAGGRLALGRDGSLHAIGLTEPEWTGFVARLDGAWAETPIARAPTGYSTPGAIALGSDGSVHVAWADATSTSLIWYARDGGPAEAVGGERTLGASGTLHGPPVELAVAADGTVRVLFADFAGSVWLATRTDRWNSEQLLTPERVSDCAAPSSGATCSTRELRWVPLGILAAEDGDAIGLVSGNQVETHAAAVCRPMRFPGGPEDCSFETTSVTTTPSLHVVAIQGAEVHTSVVATGFGGMVGTMALGPDGHIHAATYEDGLVRHIEITPAP